MPSPAVEAGAASKRTEADVRAARRYCQDCRFCAVPDTGLMYARCSNPGNPETSSPDRFIAPQFDTQFYASTVRMCDNLCGPDAKWFELKQAVAA